MRPQRSQDGRDAIVAANLSINALAELAVVSDGLSFAAGG
jgi:hypothetical protein